MTILVWPSQFEKRIYVLIVLWTCLSVIQLCDSKDYIGLNIKHTACIYVHNSAVSNFTCKEGVYI